MKLANLLSRWLRIGAGLGLAFSAHAAFFGERTPVPEGARASLNFDGGTNYVLGDVIELTFVLWNAGTETFSIGTGGDYRGTGFPTRYRFTVTDEEGTALARDDYGTGIERGGMGSFRKLASGAMFTEKLRLQNHVFVDRPGHFTVRVVHDFGWTTNVFRPLPVAEARINITLPTPEQAAKRVREIASRPPPPKKQGRDALVAGPEFPPFRSLGHPDYLPALEEQAATGDARPLEGIARIATTNATRALLRSLTNDNPDAVFAAAQFLVRRLPPRVVNGFLHQPYGWVAREDSPVHTNLWLPEATDPLRRAAVAMVRSTNSSHVGLGAHIIEAIGENEDAPAVLAGLESELRDPLTRGVSSRTNPNPKFKTAVLMRTLDALRERGWRAPTNGDSEVMLARFMELADAKLPRWSGWEQKLEAAFTNDSPVFREAAVRALPQPVTGRWEKLLLGALGDTNREVKAAACRVAGESSNAVFTVALAGIIRTEQESWVTGAASYALARIGAHWAATDAWIERVADEKLWPEALRFLADKLAHPPTSGSGTGEKPRETNAEIRDKWRHFFSDEKRRALVQAGHPVPVTEDEARDLFCGAYVLHLRSGGNWPAKK